MVTTGETSRVSRTSGRVGWRDQGSEGPSEGAQGACMRRTEHFPDCHATTRLIGRIKQADGWHAR